MHLCPKHKQYKSTNTPCPGCEAAKIPHPPEELVISGVDLMVSMEIQRLTDELEDADGAIKIYSVVALLGWVSFVIVLLISGFN